MSNINTHQSTPSRTQCHASVNTNFPAASRETIVQVKIIPELRYRVETENGVHVGDFSKADEWQGMVRLVDQTNQSLIIESLAWTEEVLSRIFDDNQKERIAIVVKASPEILFKITG